MSRLCVCWRLCLRGAQQQRTGGWREGRGTDGFGVVLKTNKFEIMCCLLVSAVVSFHLLACVSTYILLLPVLCFFWRGGPAFRTGSSCIALTSSSNVDDDNAAAAIDGATISSSFRFFLYAASKTLFHLHFPANVYGQHTVPICCLRSLKETS